MAADSEAFLRGVQLRHLRCLVAVAQERHLARAAERLALSQPAVSKTLAELEALVGERLVDRGTAGRRGIQGFTAVGEQLLAHALRVLDALEAGAQALMPASGARLQRVRVGALPSVAPSLLPPALTALRERLPGLQLQLQVQTGANAALLDALRAGELDLVVGRMSDPQLMAGLTFELLYTEPLALVARAGHPLARRAPSVQEVLQQPLVVYAEGTIPRHHTESFLSGLGLRLPPHVTQTLDLSVARALLVRSDAVWFTPIGAAQDDLASGLLVRLAVDTAGTEEPVGLLLRSDAEPSAARQALIALLREAGNEPQSRVARR